MDMGEEHPTLIKLSRGSLYYYKGNFYYPLERLTSQDKNLIKLHTKKFVKENKALVNKDRSDPNYKTKLELFDEQEKEFTINESED